MKLCILDNDLLDEQMAPIYGSYGQMLEKVLRTAGAQHWQFFHYSAIQGRYPVSFDAFDAVLLTGSKADSFSPEPWVSELRHRVTQLLQSNTKLLGVCFGHQLIAVCMGATVARAPVGWVTGRQEYQWHAPEMLVGGRDNFSLLASHQDQVLTLPENTRLLASSSTCPIAAYARGNDVLCIQPHPEFVEDYSAHLLGKRRHLLGETHYATSMKSLEQGHEGSEFAKLMVAFVEGQLP